MVKIFFLVDDHKLTRRITDVISLFVHPATVTNLGHKKWAKKVFEEALELVKENEDKDQIEDIKLIIDSFLDSIGLDGTLIMPLFNFGFTNVIKFCLALKFRQLQRKKNIKENPNASENIIK